MIIFYYQLIIIYFVFFVCDTHYISKESKFNEHENGKIVLAKRSTGEKFIIYVYTKSHELTENQPSSINKIFITQRT